MHGVFVVSFLAAVLAGLLLLVCVDTTEAKCVRAGGTMRNGVCTFVVAPLNPCVEAK